MADTDLPNGFGAIDRPSGPSRPPRPIASPFGALQTPGFNVQPDSTSTNPMASLLASLDIIERRRVSYDFAFCGGHAFGGNDIHSSSEGSNIDWRSSGNFGVGHREQSHLDHRDPIVIGGSHENHRG